MDGMLARWALAMQEYDFQIVYRKGVLNGNADALSRCSYSNETPCAITRTVPQYTSEQLRTAQLSDRVIARVLKSRIRSRCRPHGSEWRKHPLLRYWQLWHQLAILDGVLYRQYNPGPTSQAVTVPILPHSLQHEALMCNHDAPGSGHQGADKTLERLRTEAYWVSMARDVNRHCRECTKCQQCKLVTPQRAPLTSIPIGQPWQMIAADVLEVPVSSNNNRYILVVQDYFTKWAEAIPMKDQEAVRISRELTKLFATYGIPDILHSDQGRNFESSILSQTLKAFGISKSRTTPYHPQGDGMVERFNRSLLQLLRVYVEKHDDWEQYLPLVLYAYRTSVHSSTRVTPFMLMYGRQPRQTGSPCSTAFDPESYSAHLSAKLAELRDFVDTNLAAAAEHQKSSYDRNSTTRSFKIGDLVWLSIPTAKKLDPRWEGEWRVKSVKALLSVEITDGRRTQVVHVNRLHHRHQPTWSEATGSDSPRTSEGLHTEWNPPWVEHLQAEADIPREAPEPQAVRRCPQRERRAPDRYGFEARG